MKTYKAPITPQNHQSLVHGATSNLRIIELYRLAKHCPGREFIIPYTADHSDIPGAGSAQELAKLFAAAYRKRDNILYEESFARLIAAEMQYSNTKKR